MTTRYLLCSSDLPLSKEFCDDLFEKTRDKTVANFLHVDWASPPAESVSGLIAASWRLHSLERQLQEMSGKLVHASAAHPSIFAEQLNAADIIYFGGGTTNRLLTEVWRSLNWKALLSGKTIVGVSAGANVLSHVCWGLDARKVIKCEGPVHAKLIVHWQSTYGTLDQRGPIDWNKAHADLSNYKADMPMVLLREGQWQKFDI